MGELGDGDPRAGMQRDPHCPPALLPGPGVSSWEVVTLTPAPRHGAGHCLCSHALPDPSQGVRGLVPFASEQPPSPCSSDPCTHKALAQLHALLPLSSSRKQQDFPLPGNLPPQLHVSHSLHGAEWGCSRRQQGLPPPLHRLNPLRPSQAQV